MFSAVDHESVALRLQADAELLSHAAQAGFFPTPPASMFVQPRAQALRIQLEVGGQDVA